jgi:PRTRC genetic system protein B
VGAGAAAGASPDTGDSVEATGAAQTELKAKTDTKSEGEGGFVEASLGSLVHDPGLMYTILTSTGPRSERYGYGYTGWGTTGSRSKTPAPRRGRRPVWAPKKVVETTPEYSPFVELDPGQARADKYNFQSSKDGDYVEAAMPILAELLITPSQYILHYWEPLSGVNNHNSKDPMRRKECYKFLSPLQVAAAFTTQQLDSGWLPPHTLRWGTGTRGNYFVQYLPAGTRKLFIRFETVDKTGIVTQELRELEVSLPALIFFGINNSYYVWATKDSAQNISAASLLYTAPLPNVYQTGGICWGNTHPERIDGAKQFLATQRLFFQESNFNAHLSEGKSRKFPKDVRRMLEEVAREGTPFPEDDLLPLGVPTITLEQKLRQLLPS